MQDQYQHQGCYSIPVLEECDLPEVSEATRETMSWTYPRDIELEAVIWRDILKGNLIVHDDQIKRVDAIVGTVKLFKLTFHDGSVLERKWQEDNLDMHFAIFMRVKNKWDIEQWSR